MGAPRGAPLLPSRGRGHHRCHQCGTSPCLGQHGDVLGGTRERLEVHMGTRTRLELPQLAGDDTVDLIIKCFQNVGYRKICPCSGSPSTCPHWEHPSCEAAHMELSPPESSAVLSESAHFPIYPNTKIKGWVLPVYAIFVNGNVTWTLKHTRSFWMHAPVWISNMPFLAGSQEL